jgi:hypothetical protein
MNRAVREILEFLESESLKETTVERIRDQLGGLEEKVSQRGPAESSPIPLS